MRWKLSRTVLRGASGGNIVRLLDQKTVKGAKQPFYFYLKEKEVFGFAGIYEEWLDRHSGELLETCAIITTEANEILKPVHERMPVILKSKSYEQWLDPREKDTSALQRLLVPYGQTGGNER